MKKLIKITKILLLPFILFGFYYIFPQQNSAGVQTYAFNLNPDPLIVTYNGNEPPDPMFSLTNMLPGDTEEKTFNVKNESPQEESVVMKFIKIDEDKNFSEILDIDVIELPSNVVFSGKLKDLFSLPSIDLGVFPGASARNFKVNLHFPKESGNEYQNAFVSFNIVWQTKLPPIELPEECKELEGKIVNVVEGTEGNDKIHGTFLGDLILAKGGNDTIDSSSEGDCVVAGDGDDKIDSESGNDIILAGGGNDKIKSGSGNDKVWGGEGKDEIVLGSGDDIAYGEEGDDVIKGGSGNDFLDGGGDFDTLIGDSGIDTCKNGESVFNCEF